MTKYIIYYLVIINIIGFLSMWIDKVKAKKGSWRISEKNLFIVAMLGGSIGSMLGMKTVRHKTKHKKFVIGMPAVLIVQVIITVLILR